MSHYDSSTSGIKGFEVATSRIRKGREERDNKSKMLKRGIPTKGAV